jgi:hypothetical protein
MMGMDEMNKLVRNDVVNAHGRSANEIRIQRYFSIAAQASPPSRHGSEYRRWRPVPQFNKTRRDHLETVHNPHSALLATVQSALMLGFSGYPHQLIAPAIARLARAFER